MSLPADDIDTIPETRRERERRLERWSGVKASLETDEAAKAAGYEPGPDGDYVGRDPRAMSAEELIALGHAQISPMEAIRAKCLDCTAGSSNEIRLCVAVTCPSWPFRTGKNPFRAPRSEAQLEASRRAAARLHAGASDPMKIEGPDR